MGIKAEQIWLLMHSAKMFNLQSKTREKLAPDVFYLIKYNSYHRQLCLASHYGWHCLV